MKSREEYEASIFAKRDALLKKRKNNFKSAACVIGVVLCAGTAAFALPKLTSINTDTYSTAESTQALIYPEETTNIPDKLFDANGIYNFGENDDNCDNSVYYFNDSHYFASGTVTEIKGNATPPAENKNTFNETAFETEIALETEIHRENGNSSEAKPTEAPSKGNSSPSTTAAIGNNHPEIKAVNTAYSYLTNEQKAKVDMEAHKDVTVTRNADGTEYFTVIFPIDEGAYLVSVDSKTFEFVGFKERKNTTQSVSQITPAYNPNETTTLREG